MAAKKSNYDDDQADTYARGSDRLGDEVEGFGMDDAETEENGAGEDDEG